MTGNDERRFAVVTGASSGIGRELARVLAGDGFDLLITAEDAGLEEVRSELAETGMTIEAVRDDLSKERGVQHLFTRIASISRPVDLLALNAGRGAGGAFASDTDLQEELEIVDLNVRSVVYLMKLMLPKMIERGEGRILLTSSIASTMPGPFQAVYNASKSFIQSFGLALQNEIKDSGVTITLLMPGPTETEFFERAGMLDTKLGTSDKDDANEVARQGYEAAMNGDERVIAGSLSNRLQATGGRFIPDSAKAEMHRKLAEPGSGDSSSD